MVRGIKENGTKIRNDMAKVFKNGKTLLDTLANGNTIKLPV